MLLAEMGMSDLFWTGFWTFLMFVAKEISDWFKAKRLEAKVKDVKGDVKENTDVTKSVIEHVENKADSAVKAAENATAEAKKITDTAAAKVGTLIGKVLGERADRAAEKVAAAASEQNAVIVDKVAEIAKVVKGDDGTCLTAKVDEHGKAIASLQREMQMVKEKTALIEGDTKQILEILSARGAHI